MLRWFTVWRDPWRANAGPICLLDWWNITKIVNSVRCAVQVSGEIRGVLDLVEEVLSTFGFTKYEVNLSTRPEKSVGACE